jgi:glycosyltransferase involved in cell wall biosynthesis
MLSVIIPTYNPDVSRLRQTIEGLKNQTVPADQWELIIVDNNSPFNFINDINIDWHPRFRLIREAKQGLTFARVCGFREARGQLIVLVDDDNVLDKDYLMNARSIFETDPAMGAAGGKSLPLFEQPAPQWLGEFYGNLALRDLGQEVIRDSWNRTYPSAAPLGAGIVLRKKALESYLLRIVNQKNPVTDRQGKLLSSGGDNDIVLEILKSGWQVGYFPALSLRHIIPNERVQPAYLARLINNTNKSWIAVLDYHGINPWKKIPRWTVPLRKLKAWFIYSAWKNRVHYIRWRGACGMYDGLAKHER